MPNTTETSYRRLYSLISTYDKNRALHGIPLKPTDRLFGYGSVWHHESRALDSLPSSSSSLSLRLVLSLTELNASVVFLVGSYITRTDYLKMIRVYVYTCIRLCLNTHTIRDYAYNYIEKQINSFWANEIKHSASLKIISNGLWGSSEILNSFKQI